MANNLRIIYANQVVSATNSVTAITNCLNDYKSQTDTSSTFVVTTNTLKAGTIVGVAIYLSEEINTVRMVVNTSNIVNETTTSSFSTGAVGFGGGKYVTKYITLTADTTSFTINFTTTDTLVPKQVKVSKIVIGNYWSPKFNTEYGVQVGMEDSSSYERLQSGDQYVTNSPRYKTLQFNLQYLDQTDKFSLYDIIKQIGKSKAIFISIFPEDTDKEREQMYSIYGRFQAMPSISHTMFTIYASSIQLEEF
jgi:hypothetical protein